MKQLPHYRYGRLIQSSSSDWFNATILTRPPTPPVIHGRAINLNAYTTVLIVVVENEDWHKSTGADTPYFYTTVLGKHYHWTRWAHVLALARNHDFADSRPEHLEPLSTRGQRMCCAYLMHACCAMAKYVRLKCVRQLSCRWATPSDERYRRHSCKKYQCIE